MLSDLDALFGEDLAALIPKIMDEKFLPRRMRFGGASLRLPVVFGAAIYLFYFRRNPRLANSTKRIDARNSAYRFAIFHNEPE